MVAPHTRGCSFERAVPLVNDLGCPAHAGMLPVGKPQTAHRGRLGFMPQLTSSLFSALFFLREHREGDTCQTLCSLLSISATTDYPSLSVYKLIPGIRTEWAVWWAKSCESVVKVDILVLLLLTFQLLRYEERGHGGLSSRFLRLLRINGVAEDSVAAVDSPPAPFQLGTCAGS